MFGSWYQLINIWIRQVSPHFQLISLWQQVSNIIMRKTQLYSCYRKTIVINCSEIVFVILVILCSL